MNIDVERKAFETWAMGFDLEPFYDEPSGYRDGRTDVAWDAWQARAALTAQCQVRKDGQGMEDVGQWDSEHAEQGKA